MTYSEIVDALASNQEASLLLASTLAAETSHINGGRIGGRMPEYRARGEAMHHLEELITEELGKVDAFDPHRALTSRTYSVVFVLAHFIQQSRNVAALKPWPKDASDLTEAQCRWIVDEIREVLWPEGDVDAEWGSETIDWVGNIANLNPR